MRGIIWVIFGAVLALLASVLVSPPEGMVDGRGLLALVLAAGALGFVREGRKA